MTRREYISVSFLLGACGPRPEPASFSPPEAIGGAWRLKDTEPLPAGKVPAEARRLGLGRAFRAHYAGTPDLTVTFYRMKTGAGALEWMQTWRAGNGRLAFHHGTWFVVLEGEGMDHSALSSVAAAIEPLLPD